MLASMTPVLPPTAEDLFETILTISADMTDETYAQMYSFDAERPDMEEVLINNPNTKAQ